MTEIILVATGALCTLLGTAAAVRIMRPQERRIRGDASVGDMPQDERRLSKQWAALLNYDGRNGGADDEAE